MRKFHIVLLTIFFIVAFAMPVSAADVKFSGSYVAQGYYESNRTLKDPEGGSSSFGWQRARIETIFQVAEGLQLTTRFDAMEKVWGSGRSGTATSTNGSTASAEMENIKFEQAFVTFDIPNQFGTILAGYQTRGAWGTVFGNTTEDDYGFRLRYIYKIGGFTLLPTWDKTEGKKVPQNYAGIGEHDSDKYNLYGIYTWSTGQAGLQIQYVVDSSTADSIPTGYRAKYWAFNPYAKAKFGPVYVEAELGFTTGKYKDYITENTTTQQDQDMAGWRGYIMANVNLAPAYVGAMAFYASGDKKDTTDKMEGSVKTGTDFNPCLILMNYDLGRWSGDSLGTGYGLTTGGNNTDNIQGYQIFAGVKPMPKLDIKASVTYAKLNENPYSPGTDIVSKKLGYEADITMAYKIYDNLEYMIGFGYLFAGDAFKGSSAANKVDDDYLLTHKLTLTF